MHGHHEATTLYGFMGLAWLSSRASTELCRPRSSTSIGCPIAATLAASAEPSVAQPAAAVSVAAVALAAALALVAAALALAPASIGVADAAA